MVDDDHAVVAKLLGREPAGEFEVVVRDASQVPVVIRNAPFLFDGTPMPTRYWLLAGELHRRVGQIESQGGVRSAEVSVDPVAIAEAHARYEAERNAAIPPDHEGPRPSGGIGGTRQGVKCLHAHYAYFLAGGEDPVGAWVDEKLKEFA